TRTRVNSWVTGTMYNRVNDAKTGIRGLIQQRLHEEDQTGAVLATGEWEHLYLPMEFDPDKKCKTSIWEDPRTEAGQLLCPERMGPKEIAEYKKTLGSYQYSGQYQQSPSPAGGGM